MQLVQSQGPNNWVRISQHMHFRSPKQCRERFHQNLKPTLNHEPITAEEGELIEQMVAEMGKRWAEIARRLGNRSDNAVKNWWNGSMNRRRRNVIQSSSKTLSNRLEPLSAARSAASPERHRRHSYSRSWSSSQTTINRPVLESSHFSQSYSGHGSSYHSAYFPPHDGISRMPTPPYSSSNALSVQTPSESCRLPNLFSSASRPPPLLLLPALGRQFEPPMISPVNSEYSAPPPLERAPSLVSDHNSNSSISPKTMHSPRPELPAPIDTRSYTLRRGSSHSIVTPGTSYNGDEGYVSAHPQSASIEAKSFQSQMPSSRSEESLLAQHASRWQPGHQYSRSTSNPTLPPLLESPMGEREPKSARDTRMTFSSLLN